MYMQMVYAWFFPKHKPQIYGFFFWLVFVFLITLTKVIYNTKIKAVS